MTYQLDTTSLTYGDREFLAHNLKGATANDDRYLFGQRIKSYGILNFGAMSGNSSKRAILSNLGITSPILIRSAYAFSQNTWNDEIKFRLFDGNTQLTELTILNTEMPYQFPDGAIIDPSLSIEVFTNQATTQMLIYWQPVHVLQYDEIS